MLRTLPRTLALASRRSIRVAAIAAFALGALAGSLPLLELPGYELAEAGALLAAVVLAPWLGLAAVRLERARPDPSPLAAWAASALAVAALLAALFAGALVRAAFGPCDPLFAAGFLPAVALPSALLACALAVAAGFAAGGRRGRAVALYAVAALALLALRLASAWRGPEAFLVDPLWGYFPGPLYDEALPLDARVLLGSAASVGWALAVAGATAAAGKGLLGRRAGPAPGFGPRAGVGAGAALAAAGLALAAAALGAQASLQGGRDLRAGIERTLGARRDGPRCTIFLPAEKPAAAAQELLDECEFHVADVAERLGIREPPRVTVFVYRSAEEKRRLVGASRTDYTKPWRAEIHVHDEPLPHPVLRHEIVHAVASVLAPGPLHVPARARIFPSLALVEGLAVALESPRGAFTVHQWSRAARDLGYLPDLERILGPAGFWSQAPARAYTAAGSFLSWLLDRYGPGPVTAVYAGGRFEQAFGRSLAGLVREWQAFLDAVPPSADLTASARRRMGAGSLFERRCVRETAELDRRAGDAAAEGRTASACRIYDEAAARGEGADALLAKGEVLVAAGELDEAGAALDAAAARIAPDDGTRRAGLASARGDLAWRRDDVRTALARWLEAGTVALDRAEARLLAVKAAAAVDPTLGPAVRGYLLTPRDAGVLGLVALARTDRPLAAYLIGRALLQRGERAAAAAELARALRGALPPLVALEARLSLAEARCAPEDAELLAPLATAAEADRARLALARRRCAFEEATRTSTGSRSP